MGGAEEGGPRRKKDFQDIYGNWACKLQKFTSFQGFYILSKALQKIMIRWETKLVYQFHVTNFDKVLVNVSLFEYF